MTHPHLISHFSGHEARGAPRPEGRQAAPCAVSLSRMCLVMSRVYSSRLRRCTTALLVPSACVRSRRAWLPTARSGPRANCLECDAKADSLSQGVTSRSPTKPTAHVARAHDSERRPMWASGRPLPRRKRYSFFRLMILRIISLCLSTFPPSAHRAQTGAPTRHFLSRRPALITLVKLRRAGESLVVTDIVGAELLRPLSSAPPRRGAVARKEYVVAGTETEKTPR
jgi:hypothetical protein